ncbi:hypothetical protein ABZ569_33350 [Streptomyces albus]|uniref:hypothetical protein n=1 Tax=Streptomyces albus TaxID=1888 RepID=UPI0033FA2D10
MAVELAYVARETGEELERVDAAVKFPALLDGVAEDERTRRAVLTLVNSEGGTETVSTEQVHTVRGAAMVARARELTGRWVLVYRANETFQAQGRSGSMRTVVRLDDLGEGVLSKRAAWRVLLHDAGGDQGRARQAWLEAELPDFGTVSVAQLVQARQLAAEVAGPPGG